MALTIPKIPDSPDGNEIRRSLAVLIKPGATFELRSLPGRQSWIGNDLDEGVEAAIRLGAFGNLYYTLNPVREGHTRAAKDADILSRYWLMFDCDPRRADVDRCATEEEKDAARELAYRVISFVAERNWPGPVVVDSGNGQQVLYRLDLPNTARSTQWIRAILKVVAAACDDEMAHVDLSVHNASRIARLPGSWNRKGESTPERPHRTCRLILAPTNMEPVSEDQIRELIGQPEAARAETNGQPKQAAGLRIPTPPNAATAWFKRVLDSEAGKVGTARPGDRHNQLRASARTLFGQVHHGFITETDIVRSMTLVSQRAGLPDKEIQDVLTWAKNDGLANPIPWPDRLGLKPTKASVRTGGGADAEAADPTAESGWEIEIDGEVVACGPPADFLPPPAEGTRTARSFVMHTLRGLMARQFDEPVWVVPGLLSEGLNVLAGKPKMGKSMMATNLGITVAGGGMALGNTQTTAGDVLYISLEDRGRRIQSRARKMLRQDGYTISARLTIATEWPRQGEGGLELIEWWMKRVERPALVILDVWGKFRPAGNPKVNQYTQDYEHMSPLKDLMDRYSCCALALMHLRKGSSDDVVDDISGTLGLSGAADGLIVLQRSRNDNEAKIFVTGRDVADAELALQFDPETLTWKCLGPADEHVTGKLQIAILNYLRGLGGAAMFTTDIAAHLDETPDKIRPVLHRLLDRRLIRHVGKAWAYPGEDEAGEEIP